MNPQKRYSNAFDNAVPPQELLDVRDINTGLVARIANIHGYGWCFKCHGSVNPTSRALLRSLGFAYKSRKWERWDADAPPVKGWRIYSPTTKTYYAGPSAIGPRMGGTRQEAMVFENAIEALGKMNHWVFAACCLERPDGTLQTEKP